jgi:TRAP-type C4-dicarboxylate transport system permease small subunit
MSDLPWASRLAGLLAATERGVIGGLMAAIVVLTLAQVIWRYVLDDPLQWSEELARYCFVWVTLLGASTLLRVSDGHPRIDTLWHVGGRHVRRALDLFSRAMVILCSTAIAFGGLRMMQLNWEQRSPSLEIPMAWIYLSMLVAPLLGVFWTLWCGTHGCMEDEV